MSESPFIANAIGGPPRTIVYGDVAVPVIVRHWKRRPVMTPYYRTDLLQPGQFWRDAPTTGAYTEHYVQEEDGPSPVGVLIAREFLRDGAFVAVCTDLTLGVLRMIDSDLVVIEAEPQLRELLECLYQANGCRWAGLPDAVAMFPDGRVFMREAKVAKKDRLSPNQHAFARVARKVLGGALDLAVVEWGYEAAPAQT